MDKLFKKFKLNKLNAVKEIYNKDPKKSDRLIFQKKRVL